MINSYRKFDKRYSYKSSQSQRIEYKLNNLDKNQMVKSKNHGFEVKILQKLCEGQGDGDITTASYEPLREMITPLGVYVIAGPNQEFIIELKAPDRGIYAARLWIDEQEVYYKKTFKARGFFMGFKLGEGRFQSFKFAPPIYETNNSAISLTRSEIKVEFYKCRQRLVESQTILNKTIRKATDEYTPGAIKENKKFFRKSLTVQAGNEIFKPSLDPATLLDRIKDPRTRKYRENIIEYGHVLDRITIYYGDFNSLLIQGVLSLANYDHLNVIPIEQVQKKPKMVERILMTIIRKHHPKGINLEEIEAQFKKLIRGEFAELEVGPLVTFISLRNELFQLDDKNHLKCSETAKSIYLDLRDINSEGGIVPDSYFKPAKDSGLVSKEAGTLLKHKKPSSHPHGKENKNKHPTFIDLT